MTLPLSLWRIIYRPIDDMGVARIELRFGYFQLFWTLARKNWVTLLSLRVRLQAGRPRRLRARILEVWHRALDAFLGCQS